MIRAYVMEVGVRKILNSLLNFQKCKLIDGDKSTFCASFPFALFKIGLLVKSNSFYQLVGLISSYFTLLMNFFSCDLTFEFINLQASQECIRCCVVSLKDSPGLYNLSELFQRREPDGISLWERGVRGK